MERLWSTLRLSLRGAITTCGSKTLTACGSRSIRYLINLEHSKIKNGTYDHHQEVNR